MHCLLWASGIQWLMDYVFGIIEQETSFQSACAACRLEVWAVDIINVEDSVS